MSEEKPAPGFRNPDAAQKLSPIEFKECITLARRWPTHQQVVFGKFLKHCWWLQKRNDLLEKENHQLKSDSGVLHEAPPKHFVAEREVDDGMTPETRKAKRFYEWLSLGLMLDGRSYLGYSKAELVSLANEHARKYDLPEIK
jgi:hypothetical protein